MAEKEIYAVSLTFDDEDIYYIPVYGFVLADYLIEKMTELINTSKNRSIVIDNLKDYLPIFDKTGVDEHSFMDIAVAHTSYILIMTGMIMRLFQRNICRCLLCHDRSF